MREPKFRGKRIDTGSWVYGHYFQSPLTDENSGASSDTGWFFLIGEVRHCIEQNHVVYTIEPESLEQYTGKHDIEGKEIYEGDIVEANWPYASKGVCTWDNDRAGFYYKPLNGLGKASYDKGYKLNASRVKIIGRIDA